jgi:hypothetical protein
MIGLAAGTRIWIVAGVTDLRRGFVSLSGLVQHCRKIHFRARCLSSVGGAVI